MNSGAAAQIATHNEAITTVTPVASTEAIFRPGSKLLGEGMYTSQLDGAHRIRSRQIRCEKRSNSYNAWLHFKPPLSDREVGSKR